MVARLEKAIAEVAKLSDQDQEAFADLILAELTDEAAWQNQFAARPDALERLAHQARANHKAGLTEPIEDLFR